MVPTNFEEDRWIQAAEARPGAREVVHHIIVFVSEEKGKLGSKRNDRDGIGNGFLAPYAPGDMPAVFAPGSAKKVPKGANLIFQMHYTPNGVEQTDRSSVGLIFAKEPPKPLPRRSGRAATQQKFMILPGESNHEVKSATKFDQDVDLLSLLPHMHLRGKDFIYKAVYPDGKEETHTVGTQIRLRLAEQAHRPLAKPLHGCRRGRRSNARPISTIPLEIRTIPTPSKLSAGATRRGRR